MLPDGDAVNDPGPPPLVSGRTLGILTILFEAEDESDAGMLGVAEVIRNRTVSRFESSGTVADTCLRPAQFDGWSGHDHRRARLMQLSVTDPLVLRAGRAWDRAWESATDVTQGAVMYYAPKAMVPPGSVPAWEPEYSFTVTLGSQRFYRPIAGAATT